MAAVGGEVQEQCLGAIVVTQREGERAEGSLGVGSMWTVIQWSLQQWVWKFQRKVGGRMARPERASVGAQEAGRVVSEWVGAGGGGSSADSPSSQSLLPCSVSGHPTPQDTEGFVD